MTYKIKTIWFLLLFFILFPFIIKAQTFKGGLFAGIAASQISGDQLAGFKKAGIYAGGYSNVFFNEKFGLQLELYYIQKGSRKIPKQASPANYTYKLQLHYIEMPLLFEWNITKRFFFEIGPAIGVLMKNRGVEKDGNGVIPGSYRPAFNKIDFSGIAGLGVNITKHFKANFRYSNSIIPVRKPQLGTAYRLDRYQYNSSLIFSIIYQI